MYTYSEDDNVYRILSHAPQITMYTTLSHISIHIYMYIHTYMCIYMYLHTSVYILLFIIIFFFVDQRWQAWDPRPCGSQISTSLSLCVAQGSKILSRTAADAYVQPAAALPLDGRLGEWKVVGAGVLMVGEGVGGMG